jgi:hypothetical protein
MLPRFIGAALLALSSSGCGAAGFTVHDLKLSPSGDTLYVLARNGHVSRNFCASLGGDVARAEGRLASADGRTIRIGRVTGCYTVRHIIVCAEDDTECLAHEERHRDHGDFHR